MPDNTPPRLFPEDHATEVLASRCEGEVLQVLDDPERRWLKYRHGALQTALCKARPERLVLPYTQAMAVALLFVPDPRRVLILGLGGGAMAHFFLHHFPDVSLTVIEREPQCVDIAHEFFSIPRRHRNLEIITGDARDVAPRLGGKFDLIMLDLFLSHGPPAWLGASDLFDACRARMARQGILSANFWADPEDEELTCLRGVSAAFGGRLLLIPVSGYRNVVALGFTPGFELDDLPSLRKRARGLSSRVGFDVGKWLEVIGKTNRRNGTRLVI